MWFLLCREWEEGKDQPDENLLSSTRGQSLKLSIFPKGWLTWELSLRGHVENFQGYSRQPILLIVVKGKTKKDAWHWTFCVPLWFCLQSWVREGRQSPHVPPHISLPWLFLHAFLSPSPFHLITSLSWLLFPALPFSACVRAEQEMKEWTIPFTCLPVVGGGGRKETKCIFKPLVSSYQWTEWSNLIYRKLFQII